MVLEEIDFETCAREKSKRLEVATEMVLSTSSDGKVTSRVISVSCSGERIYFMSLGTNTKAIQILQNPNVSLCSGKFAIEGEARRLGDALDQAFSQEIEQYKLHQAENYEIYAIKPGMQLFEIQITKIAECFGKNESFTEWVDYLKKKHSGNPE